MNSGMRSTSALYPTYPCQRKQSSDEKPHPWFGEHGHEQFNGQLNSAMNPNYSTPASYLMHQNQNHGFGVQQSYMLNNGPLYNQVQNPSYSTPASYLLHQNQIHGSGVQQNPMMNGPFSHPLKNPSYSSPASYPMHQNQYYGFSVQRSPMTHKGAFCHPGFIYHHLQKPLIYPVHQPAAVQVQESATYPVGQPATAQAPEAPTYTVHQSAAAQAQAQQVEVQRNAEEEVLDIMLETRYCPLSRPRLKWTPELHERFICATTQLGGLYKATPKAIQKRMKVRGLTLNHIKSHLQKARCGKLNIKSVEEITRHGTQDNTNSYASPITEDEVPLSYTPNYESDMGRYGNLFTSSETPNYQQNLMIALSEDHANYFNFKDFDLDQIAL